MSDYIKRNGVMMVLGQSKTLTDGMRSVLMIPSADVVEVGKAYPRAEFEKYGLSEWKDKDGQRWVMIERKEK